MIYLVNLCVCRRTSVIYLITQHRKSELCIGERFLYDLFSEFMCLSKDFHFYLITHHRKSELCNGERDFTLGWLIFALFIFEWSLSVCFATTFFHDLTSRNFCHLSKWIFSKYIYNRDFSKPFCMSGYRPNAKF